MHQTKRKMHHSQSKCLINSVEGTLPLTQSLPNTLLQEVDTPSPEAIHSAPVPPPFQNPGFTPGGGSVLARHATGGSLYAQNLRLRGRLSPTICARLDRSVNALQLCH